MKTFRVFLIGPPPNPYLKNESYTRINILTQKTRISCQDRGSPHNSLIPCRLKEVQRSVGNILPRWISLERDQEAGRDSAREEKSKIRIKSLVVEKEMKVVQKVWHQNGLCYAIVQEAWTEMEFHRQRPNKCPGTEETHCLKLEE